MSSLQQSVDILHIFGLSAGRSITSTAASLVENRPITPRPVVPLHRCIFIFFLFTVFFSDECTIHNLDPNASKAAHIET